VLLWYEESLKIKQGLMYSSQSDESQYHYEMGKTINGLAAWKDMSGQGNVDWEKVFQAPV
jgi:hypothetical protein